MAANPYDELVANAGNREGAAENPYDAIVANDGRAQQLRAARIVASSHHPDAYAKADAIARRNGWPVEVVADNLDDFAEREELDSLDAVGTDTPQLGDWLSDRSNMAIARDDIGPLTKLARAMSLPMLAADHLAERGKAQQATRERGPAFEAAPEPNLLEELAGNFRSGYQRGKAFTQNVIDLAPGGPKVMDPATGQWTHDRTGESAAQIAGHERRAQSVERTSTATTQGWQKLAQAEARGAGMGELAGIAITHPRTIMTTVAQSLGSQGPQLALSAAMPASRIAAATTAGTSSGLIEAGATIMDSMQDDGIDTTDAHAVGEFLRDTERMAAARTKAAKRGVAVGTFDALTAGVAGRLLANARRSVLSIGTRVAAEGATQGAGGMAGEATAQALTGEYSATSIIMEGLAEGPTFLAEGRSQLMQAREHATANQDRFDARDERKALDSVVSLAQSSRTRERDADRFEALMGTMTREGADTVYLDGETVLAHYQAAGVDPREAITELTGNPSAYAETAASGAELAVPLARYASRVSPESHQALAQGARLLPGMTTRPNTPLLSAEDVSASAVESDSTVTAQFARTEDSAGQVFDSFYSQLAPLAGDSAARHYAATMAQFHRTLGQRLGIDPLELHQRFPITVQRPMDGPASVTIESATTAAPSLLDRAKSAVRSLTQSDRGRIDIVTSPEGARSFRITLNEGADASTFLHEGGHAFLEIFGELASADDAPAQVKADWATILSELGVESREQIGTEQHERFARMAEAYYRTGRAPSPALQRAFARFKVLLTALYRSLSDLDVQLSEHARGVFDRMLATDAEIADARATQGLGALFATAKQAGMSEAEFSAYRQAIVESHTTATERVARAERKAEEREQRAWWTTERNRLQTGIEAELEASPVYRARKALWNMGEDGDKVKLSKGALEAMGADLGKLKGAYTLEGGMHPDAAAELFGFDSGQAMLEAVTSAPPLQQAARTQADAQMRERHPAPSRESVTVAATHNREATDVLVQELRSLETRTGAARMELAVVREAAERIIAGKRLRDLRPESYRLAEQAAARDASHAVARGDLAAAVIAQRRRLLNFELYRAAHGARNFSEKAGRFIGKFGRTPARQRLGRAGGDYLAQIDALRDRFDFRTGITGKESDRRRSLVDWVTAQEEAGFEVNIPDRLRNDAFRKPWRELTLEELREIHEAVVQIDHLSKIRNEMLEAQDQRSYEDTRDQIVSGIESHHQVTPEEKDYSGSRLGKFRDFIKSADAWLRKTEFVFTWLDGEQANGPVWRALFKPLVDAEANEQRMMKEASAKVREILAPYRGMAHQRITVRGAGTFNKPALLAIALNWGNEGNRDALLRGQGWTREQGEAVLDRLTSEDWDTVERIWRLIDSYWPLIAKQQKELTGLAPPKVHASPFRTPSGRDLRGGYYPLKYDASVSERAHVREAALSVKEQWGGSFARAQTRQGHTIARTSSGGQPVLLELGVATEHLANVIHDLTHRKAVMDVARLIEDGQVREAIKGTAGTQVYRQLKPWLQAIATDTRQPINYVERFLGRARVGATVVNMGWKITTAIVQPLGILQTVEMIGEKYTAIGVADFFRAPREKLAFAMERSKLLPHRMTTFDRDVKDTLGRIVDGSRMDDVRRTFFIFTGLTDMSVAIPSWLGGYRKAMEGNVPGIERDDEAAAIDFADQVVRMSQSSGSVKDLAQIQRGHEMMRLLTMFYSYFNVLYNLGRRRITATQTAGDLPRLAASALWLWLVPTVLSEVIAGRGPGDDEEWEEWLSSNAGMFATYPLQSIPLLRDIVNAVVKPYGYELTPAADAIEQSVRAVKIIPKAWNEEEVEKKDVKAIVMASSYWGALPGRQAWITGSYLHDVATGEEQPESVLEFLHDAAFARK